MSEINYNAPSVPDHLLNVFFVLDQSGSMHGERINQLNLAMEESLKVAEDAAYESERKLAVRVLGYSDDVKWIIGNDSQGVEHVENWTPVKAIAGTATHKAYEKIKSCMRTSILGAHGAPIVIHITDGASNYPEMTYKAADELAHALTSRHNPEKDCILRVALAVKGANMKELEAFASKGTIIRDGKTEENVPFVFSVEDINTLKTLLKNITFSSMVSVSSRGTNEEQFTMEMSEEDEWED